MLMEQKTQKEIVRLLNEWSKGYETELLEQLAEWTNNNFISLTKIVPNKYHTRWKVVKREEVK